MKFICLLITFNVLHIGKHQDYTKFRNNFAFKYFKTKQIESIESGHQIRSYYSNGGETYDDVCEISLKDGRLATVLEECYKLMREINTLK